MRYFLGIKNEKKKNSFKQAARTEFWQTLTAAGIAQAGLCPL
jgi:hypothetical protein